MKHLIENRDCFIICQGRSLEELEKRINPYSALPMEYYQMCNAFRKACVITMGRFDIIEDHIFNCGFYMTDIVFHCASVPNENMLEYEEERIKRIQNFLSNTSNKSRINPCFRYKNMWATTYGIVRDVIVGLNYKDFYAKFKDQIFEIDSIFPKDNISHWMDVPNSVTLAIGGALWGGAKRIIIFGMDGYEGDSKDGVNSYFMPEKHKKERMLALGTIIDEGINRDTKNFKERFPIILEEYRKLFKNNCPIYNCSPNSVYTVPQKITYKQLEEILNEENGGNK